MIRAMNIAQVLRNHVNSVKKEPLSAYKTTPLTAPNQLLVRILSPMSEKDNLLPLDG